jgi:hypothetical protein
MSEFTNHGKKWTVKETKQLLKETQKIDNMDNIAKIHKRTPYAIYLKLVKEASKIADEDYEIDLEDLAKKVGLTPQALLDGFKKIKYDFVSNDEDSEDDYPDYDHDNEDESEEVSNNEDDNKSEKKIIVTYEKEIMPISMSIMVIIINLAGWYYYLLQAKLI